MDSLQRFESLMCRDITKLDRVLIDYWGSPEIDTRLCHHYNVNTKDELLDHLGIDFRYIEGPKYIGPSLTSLPDGSIRDIWGVPRKMVSYGEGEFRGTYKTVSFSPLEHVKSAQELESYPYWPDPDWFDYGVIAAQCKRVHDKGKVVMFMGDRLNRFAQLKPMMYLRGVERTLSDLIRKSPMFDSILTRFLDFYKEYLERIIKAANGQIDVIITGDDFGQQDGMLCSPRTWRKKLLPGFQDYLAIIKGANIYSMHHSCGSITPIIPDMIDAGLDILNPIQPNTFDMDHTGLKQRFGDKLVFHGGISLQGSLRFGKPTEISQEVQLCCQTLGKQGGYIVCSAHNLNADMRTENIVALFDAYQEHTPYRS